MPDAPLRGGIDLAALAAQREAAERVEDSNTVLVTEESLQSLAEQSVRTPVLISLGSSASPASGELQSRLEAIVAGYRGVFVLGYCDIDAQPAIAQAFQVQAVPAVLALIGGRPAPLFQGNASDEQIRDVLEQVLQIAQQSGMDVSGSAERPPADPSSAAPEPEPEPLPPLHQEAYDAIERDDYDAAIAAYDKALVDNPRDADARAGRAQVRLMQRVAGLDLRSVRAAAADAPDDVAAQFAVADLDVTGGQVDDAFGRLLDLIGRTAGDEREMVRERLVELFDVAGAADPRVVSARQRLASALY
jgi:putative thioredoxin